MGVWKCQTHDLCCVNSIVGADKFCWVDRVAVAIMPFECACVNAREGILHNKNKKEAVVFSLLPHSLIGTWKGK